MSHTRQPVLLALLAGLAVGCAAEPPRVVTPPPLRPQTPVIAPSSPVTPAPAPSPAKGVPAAPGITVQPPGPAAQAAPAPTLRRQPPAPVRAAGRGRQIVLNFDNADIEAVIQAASEIVGFNYALAPGVAGKKVTVQTAGRIPEEEVFNVLLAVLEVNGVTAVRSGSLYKIVPIAAAREKPLPTIIGAQADPTRPGDEVITQIIPILHVAPERIAAAIRPFVQGGNIVVHGTLLILTDTVGNIARLLQIVAVLDVETPQDEFRMIPVRYADAVELAGILIDFFSGRRVRTAAPSAPAPVPAVPPRGTPATPGAPPSADVPERPPLILSDKRTNTLIVSARRADLEILTQFVTQLDVDVQTNKRVFVFYVENVKAKDLAATLTEVFGRPSTTDSARAPRRETAPPTTSAGGPAATPPRTGAPPLPTPAGAGRPEGEPGVVEGEVRVVADEPNNALIITTFPGNWPLIEDTIRKLDRTPKQVLIEVLVAEISLDDENRLGLEWTLRTQQNVNVGGQPFNVGNVARLDVGPTAPTLGAPTLPVPVGVPPLSGLSFFIFETDRFLGLLNLYANYGKLTVLSSPHILTSENKTAVINVSDSVPIVTQQVVSQTGTTTTQALQAPTNVLTQNVEYRDAGIILTVTPRISDKRVVALDVKQTVNNVGAPQPPSGSPIIIKREAETSVVLHDGQTLVLGGLIQTRTASTQVGIPWLARLPIIGFLFGATGERVQRVELLLLVTPRVIGDPVQARELYDRIRAQRPALEQGLRTHPSILAPQAVESNGSLAPPPAPADPAPLEPPAPRGYR